MNEIQKDLVLDPCSFAYVLDQTKGNVSCWVGPSKTSLSQSDSLVRFNNKTKKFEPCEYYSDAIQSFVSIPEGWYTILKNPAPDNRHPIPGTSNAIPEGMQVGKKISIKGPANFALYPGQMAQVVQGHTLRSNQYLIAKVYDADSLNKTSKDFNYFNGQILVIKGTEVSFYIPPTGIEVKAIENDPDKGYVRDAITLERLEYCILKDEDGNRRYAHGPEVVFPSPTETFIQDNEGHIKRNAIELSDISGVYVKVISDYKDESGEHKTGDELFITGKEQMIYYPRPEHTFITYNGRTVYYAVAIPKGEGRYIMNRLTGEIKTVHGPAMYLPDPRFEVFIKRTLTYNQCKTWYPGNNEVLAANGHLNTNSKDIATKDMNVGTFADQTMYATSAANYVGTPTRKEKNSINRSNTFTQPRSISLSSSKYEGAVAIDVWTGYAINLISKDGARKVIKGPQTVLLDYDQTLETLELSTGKPKTTDKLEKVVFLRYKNNRVSDIINVETSDFVHAEIKVSYNVNFDEKLVDLWFSVDNYVKHLCDWGRTKIKRAVKKFGVAELYENYHKIVVEAISDSEDCLYSFNENGMTISDIEILALRIENSVQDLINEHQEQIISRTLDLVKEKNSSEVNAQIIALEREKVQLQEEFARYKEELKAETNAKELELQVEHQKARDEESKRQAEANFELQKLKDATIDLNRERFVKDKEVERASQEKMDELAIKREAASAAAMKTVLEALGPELAASMTNEVNREVLSSIAKSVSPYAIARNESVSDAVSTLIRGTSLGDIMKQMMVNK